VTPCLTGAVLSAGNGTGRGFGTGACGEETAAVAPTANVSYAPGDPRAGERVTFDARNSTDPDGSITAYEWEFGDGTTATGETATRTYDAAGEYAVTLTVTDDDGTTNATTETVSVDPAPALVWNDAADWDASDGSGVVHDDFGDHAAGVVELGTPADSLSGKPVVGYWPLDGSGASTAEDVSGGGYDGSPSGGVAGSVPGIHGTTGYEFDGTGWVELPGFPDLQRDFSVVAWMKTDDRTEGGQRVFVDDERNAGGYALSVGDQGNAGRLRFYSRGMDTVSLDSSGRPIGTDQWHLVVGVADLTNDTRTVYVDGTRVGRFDPDSGTWGTDGGSAAIGGETAAGETGNRFDGTIDEVRVVDGDLSASEVSSLYDAATNGSVVTDARTYSGPVDVADLALGGVSLVEPGGTNVTVAVEAYDAAAGTWRSSDPIDVAEANEGPYRIPGLGGAYERYRLRVSLESTSPTESPCFGGAVLVGDGESAPATDGDGCDATAE
jgi:PKD repeat protein